ncbi:sensor histidine kinase [Heyndrickxia oleronia]|uniref:histidine kinase n=1 Tax=Heyndrickxia oleronia TaxID=38875 RepID=A0AAW6SUG0_9BACI|nr:sensor histidine kinase [Heyndrickxia oleronia]MCM3240317.1 sensor histidine kinase [Heyndrickxia oleronia]MDH5161930.1 sensor histidine kinase [Heyndrickxia oleronia]
MKIFLRSHFALLFMVLVQGGFTWLYFWFLGFQGWGHVLYVLLMQIILLGIYLAYRWMNDSQLYKWITTDEKELRYIPSFGNGYFNKVLHQKIIEEKDASDQLILEGEAEIKEKATFMNQWVHQMKTPISVIQLMIQDYDDPVFQDIRKEIYKLEMGLKTVLYSSRLSLFEKDYQIERIPINTFIKELVKENKSLFFQFKVYPNMIMDDQDLYILSDKKWIKFVIEQVLSNALKYSSEKSNKVDIRLAKQDEQVILTITDYGVGIPEQDVKRVFEPYFTGMNGRRYHESTGMGLYLVKEILHKLAHDFSIDTEINKGTSFSIIFNV